MSPVQPRRRLQLLGRLLRPLATPRGTLALVLLVAGLAATEWFGRQLSADPGDVLLLLALGMLLFVTAAIGGVDMDALGTRLESRRARLATRLTAAWPQIGVDFRDDPTTPSHVPRVVVRVTVALFVVTVLVIAWNVWPGASLRPLLAPRFYLLYLLLLAVLWAGLLMATMLGVLMAIMTARHVQWLRGGERARVRRMTAAWLLVLFVAGSVLPVEVAMLLGMGAILLTVAMASIVRMPRLTLIWRTGSDGRLGTSSWATLLWQASALPMAAFLLFLAAALSGTWSWWPTQTSSTPLTDGLAQIAAWCMAPGFLALSIVVTLDLKRLTTSNPATPCPTTVHVTLETTVAERSRVERLFARRGWPMRTPPEPPRSTDVRLRLVDSPMPRPPGGWPLPVSARALEVPELLDLIARRDVVQRRRLLRRGLERLFKMLRGRDFEQGEGFWIAPHLWFVSATTRDTEEEDLSEDGLNNEIGMPYARLFPLPARHHLYVVLREVEVDIILLEDGVRWSAFRRVVDRIFTHYDERRGRIEERDFSGILGVRVILHELEPGGQLEVEGYPEPDYTDLARGRILHVFKDRGGQEDETEPVPSEDTGVLVGV